MTLRLVALTLDVPDGRQAADFWAGLLGREAVDHDGALLLPGDDTQVGLRFVTDPATPGDQPHRAHLHVTSAHAPSHQHVIDAAVDLGARNVDVGQLPDEDHVVLADPSGSAFCVIEPTNNFLAGTGLLGELACEGTREVGVFWSEALGWPLVWDSDGETAVQSPAGGTKVAWGGPPIAPIVGRIHERLDLAAPSADLDAEAERLVALGARRVDSAGDDITLVDPDGQEFRLAPERGAGHGG